MMKLTLALAAVTLLAVAGAVAACGPATLASSSTDVLPMDACADAGTSWVCGGDPGTFELNVGSMEVTVSGGHAYNFYEVYTIASVSSAITTRAYVGGFATNNAGAGTFQIYTDGASSPSTPSYTQLTGGSGWSAATVGGSAGVPGDVHFILYSRGPWGSDDGSGGTCYNTVNSNCDVSGTATTATLANPTVGDDGVQFVTCTGDDCNDSCVPTTIAGGDSHSVELFRCSDVPGTSWSCGGDPLASFSIDLSTSAVSISGANAYNLYEVYVISSLSSPTSDREYLGVFTTDSAGSSGDLIRRAPSGTPTSPTYNEATSSWTVAATGDLSGLPKDVHFIAYSRGPWGDASSYNTVTSNTDSSAGAADTQLANPPVTDSALVQFISCEDPCDSSGSGSGSGSNGGECDDRIPGFFFYQPENLLLRDWCDSGKEDCSSPIDTQTRWGWAVAGKTYWEVGTKPANVQPIGAC